MVRQLSFAGVIFDIKELSLSKDFTGMYNDSVKRVIATCVIIEMIHCYFPYLLRVHCKCLLVMLSTCGFICEIIVDICCCCCCCN